MNRIVNAGLLLGILFVSGCQRADVERFDTSNTVRIAIYGGEGTSQKSIKASMHMFEWMGYSVSIIDAVYLNKGDLSAFNILCIPGGDMYQYSLDISSEGKDAIRNFVHAGGGYLGICGGAYFACETVIWQGEQLDMTLLNLLSGTARGPADYIVPYPRYGMCEVLMVTNECIRVEPESVWMMYSWGPELLPDDTVCVVGIYNKGRHAALVAFEYGSGRVFLIGTHPENEENSDRDGLSFGEELDDKGSDWDLMKKAVLWCLKEVN